MTSPDPLTEIHPAKLARKRASMLSVLVSKAEADPENLDRWDRLRSAMAEIDALGGVAAGADLPPLGKVGTRQFYHALGGFYSRHGQGDAAIQALRSGVGVDPGDTDMRWLWLQSIPRERVGAEAREVLSLPEDGSGPAPAAAAALLRKAAKLLQHAGLPRLSLDVLERAAAIDTPSAQMMGELIFRAEAIGDGEGADRHRARLQTQWAGRLPERLGDGLDGLGGLGPPARLPEAPLAWAWSLADQDAWTREEWLAAVGWGMRATKLIVQWWSLRSDQAHQLDELIDPPDLGPVRAGHAARRAQILVGAHLGPVAAGVHFLESSKLPVRTLGGAGLDRQSGSGSTLLPIRTRSSVSRTLIEHVRNGAVLAIGGDAPGPNERIEADFLGRRVAVKNLPARLAQRYGCDSWWFQPLWRGERIIFQLERLPDPAADEPPEAWARRWARAYLDRLEPVMRGDPRNMNLSGGIWRFADAVI